MKRIFFMIMIIAMPASVLMFQGCVKNPALPGPAVHSAPDSAVCLIVSNFDSLVLDSGTVAVVEFYSAHCSICAGMMWVIDSLAKTTGDSALVGAVNTDVDDSLWRRYSVSTVPSYLLFKSGMLVARRSYASPDSTAYDTLFALVRELIAGNHAPDTADTNHAPDTTHRSPVILDKTNFSAQTVIPGRVAMVEFFSPLCGACQMMDTVITALAVRYADTALIAKVNVLLDDTLQYAFNIQSWPTLVFLVGGTEVQRVIGVTPEDSLAAIIDSLLATPHQ